MDDASERGALSFEMLRLSCCLPPPIKISDYAPDFHPNLLQNSKNFQKWQLNFCLHDIITICCILLNITGIIGISQLSRQAPALNIF